MSLYIAEAVNEYIAESSRPHLLDLLSTYKNFGQANEGLKYLTGIWPFFSDQEVFDEFWQVLVQPTWSTVAPKNRQWGDFQTPPALVAQICHYLADCAISPRVIIEPTYGVGNFVLGALKFFPRVELIYGVEIQKKYEWQLKLTLLARALYGERTPFTTIELCQDDIFTHRFPDKILNIPDLLIIGNPPWVTNAELGALNSQNLPAKRNLKSFNGLDALTGKSNFDLAEFVLLRMLKLFSAQCGTLAMLCKNSVIKNIVEILPKQQFPVANIRTFEINAGREFGAAVDASLLVLDMGVPKATFTCQVATLQRPNYVIKTFGWTRNKFVSNISKYELYYELDGESPLIWRQGLKHDCAKIMELDVRDEVCVNGKGEVINVEEDRLYWLLKSSDLRKFEVGQARKKVIVTQRHLGEDTSILKQYTPKLWEYLTKNSEYFERRKSKIYLDKSPFSIFGVGEYSFRMYKVAISGLYKEPRFSLIPPISNLPVLLDDTCYFLGFDIYSDALFTASLLNCQIVKQFLQSIVFVDAKRPYTKELLMRINLTQVASDVSFDSLCLLWDELGYKPSISVASSDFEEFKQRLLIVNRSTERVQQLNLGI